MSGHMGLVHVVEGQRVQLHHQLALALRHGQQVHDAEGVAHQAHVRGQQQRRVAELQSGAGQRAEGAASGCWGKHQEVRTWHVHGVRAPAVAMAQGADGAGSA